MIATAGMILFVAGGLVSAAADVAGWVRRGGRP